MEVAFHDVPRSGLYGAKQHNVMMGFFVATLNYLMKFQSVEEDMRMEEEIEEQDSEEGIVRGHVLSAIDGKPISLC